MGKAIAACGACHSTAAPSRARGQATKLLAIVGSPNVGKSVLFQALTGTYATVSNYPGTTVEVTEGRGSIGEEHWRVVDTPGMYSLLPTTEEERVSRRILLAEQPGVVLHVVDAKNLERMLPLTLQLLEAGLPLILVLNIMDEAESRGIEVDVDRLHERLRIPVVPTVSTSGRGVAELKQEIARYEVADGDSLVKYSDAIEAALDGIAGSLPQESAFGRRALSLLLLQEDAEAEALLQPEAAAEVKSVARECAQGHAQPLTYVIATRRQETASELATSVLQRPAERRRFFTERLSDFLINPWTGVPVLLLVLYFGLYKFVGELGAGVVVDFLERHVFEGHINPLVEKLASRWLPWPAIHALVAGEYGVVTLGARYAVAIIFPIVTFFFIAFSVMEDTGYLPRLALLIDRTFKRIGLSGRGVIPIVLGFGCDTMATMVTRTLPTVRERIIATMLLALAIPCSAQLGVILAVLHGRPGAFAVWAGAVGATFLLVGFLAARLMPGAAPHFFMELPPLRLPKVSNVVTKTYTRVVWYLKEVLPLFLLASVLIWVGQLTGLFDLALRALAHPMAWIGLPPEAGRVFLFGFFRRDYGAAGLYDLSNSGAFDGIQLTVATVALTLFLPCIAQFLMNVKERGVKVGLVISLFTLAFAFVAALAIGAALRGLHLTL